MSHYYLCTHDVPPICRTTIVVSINNTALKGLKKLRRLQQGSWSLTFFGGKYSTVATQCPQAAKENNTFFLELIVIFREIGLLHFYIIILLFLLYNTVSLDLFTWTFQSTSYIKIGNFSSSTIITVFVFIKVKLLHLKWLSVTLGYRDWVRLSLLWGILLQRKAVHNNSYNNLCSGLSNVYTLKKQRENSSYYYKSSVSLWDYFLFYEFLKIRLQIVPFKK